MGCCHKRDFKLLKTCEFYDMRFLRFAFFEYGPIYSVLGDKIAFNFRKYLNNSET